MSDICRCLHPRRPAVYERHTGQIREDGFALFYNILFAGFIYDNRL